jgi:beta-glucanase (GH16 family)
MFKRYWLLVLIFVFSFGMVGISDVCALTYTSGVTSASSTQALFWLKPSGGTCSYVILHYTVSGTTEQNVYMTYNSSTTQWEYSVSSLTSGQTITYNFTYSSDGLQYDTSSATWTVATSPSSSYSTLVWSDEFNGTSLDRSNWNYQLGNGYNSGSSSFDGWGNGEWEWYRSDNVSVSNGNLVITGEYLSSPQTIQGRTWYQFSGRITTKGLRTWQYGRVEARIKLPIATATWPAFWMMGSVCDTTVNGSTNGYDRLPTNWASCGEIDIMEHKNDDTQICSNLFWDTRTDVYPYASASVANNSSWTTGVDVSQYHIYAIEWNATTITWYLDGAAIKTQDCSATNMEEFRQPFFIILNLAIAGQFPGTTPIQSQFPVYMYVDYVRVYQ